MHLQKVEHLKPGDIVARPVWDENGRILLHAGVALVPEYIRGLETKGFTQIYVRDPEFPAEGVEAEDDIGAATRAQALKVMREAFEAVDEQVKNRLKKDSRADMLDVVRSDTFRGFFGPDGPVAKVQETVSQIMDDVLTRSTLAGLTSIKSACGKTYEHSLDVCVLAIMIGRNVGMPHVRLTQLAAGCLLHDIGDVFLDKEMDEETRVHQHTRLGFELLRNSPDPDIMAPHVAYEHHERQDGKGLPRGLKGSNTIKRERGTGQSVPTLIGEICAVANAYDNLLTGSAARAPLPPELALRVIYEGAGTLFNREVVKAFLTVTPVFPKGVEVIIRTDPYRNFTGIVSKINITRLDRPVIKVIRTARGHAIEPFEMDLMQEVDAEVRIRSWRPEDQRNGRG